MKGTHQLTAIMLAASALLASTANASMTDDVCGTVIAVECRTESGRVQLVISRAGASQPEQVEVDANAATRGLGAEKQYLFRPVCASKTDGTATGTVATPVTSVAITGVETEPPDSPWREVRLCDLSITPPRLVRSVRPVPPAESLAHHKTGTVWLDVLVDGTGRVADARVTHSIDREYGGDAAAVATVKQWGFAPATRGGEPISVVVTVVMTFAVSN